MRSLRRLLGEAQRANRLGRNMETRSKLAEMDKLLSLLGLDAAKAAGIRTGG